jgi:BarA-like signal transduction histidine kinase
MNRMYEIKSRAAELGGGGKLALIEDNEEAGSVFPVLKEDSQVGMAWRNALSEEQRAYWLMMAASAISAAARHAFLLAEAYDDAQEAGKAWTG